MPHHYVWLIWATAFLVPWGVLYVATPARRHVMWRASLVTAPFGLTEPIFVPEYWNPPSLFDLAQRTGFDIESLIFTFAIGGIGAALYDAVTRRPLSLVSRHEREHGHHRWHRVALLAPFAVFVPLYLIGWNPIYPSILTLLTGAIGSVFCRPDLKAKALIGGGLFLGLYAVFMVGLRVTTHGYIDAVWNLETLSGAMVAGVPLEELVFGLTFGMYWSGAYEHLAWRTYRASPA